MRRELPQEIIDIIENANHNIIASFKVDDNGIDFDQMTLTDFEDQQMHIVFYSMLLLRLKQRFGKKYLDDIIKGIKNVEKEIGSITKR